MKIITVNDYVKQKYGKKMYKLALSCSTTCPNRDGTIGTGGCIFCPNGASDGFAQLADVPISEQIEKAKALVESKNKGGGYIAYFQTFTITYAPISHLRKVFFETINRNDIDILSMATRPDCLDDDVLSLIAELNKIKPVWVELGLQTIHKKTADYIRRGYELDVYDHAIKKLKDIGVHTIVHLIIGLPGESEQDMISSAKYVGQSGADGIKLQLLHILRGCDLENEYNNGKIHVLELEEYTNILCKCIAVLPEDIVIHRLTGDGAKSQLIAPLWSGDKKRVMNYVNRAIAEYKP